MRDKSKSHKEGKSHKESKSHIESKGHIVGGIIFTAIYLLVIYWFQDTKIWPDYYYQPSRLYIIYHLLRVVFIFYLGCCFYAMGRVVMGVISRKLKEDFTLRGLERFVITSYTGSAVLLVMMFFIGLMKGYYTIVAVMITAPLVYLSYPDVRGLIRSIKGFYKGEVVQGIKAEGKVYAFLVAVIGILTLFQVLYVLVSKGLMPDLLTNDTVSHYLPYYQEAIDSHTNWINRYWIHFFYSKGAGLFFLASLLTDVQSTQLVSFYFYLLAGLTLVIFITRFVDSHKTLWGYIALLLFFSFSALFTIEMRSGFDHNLIFILEFQKSHPVIASYILCVALISIFSFPKDGPLREKQAISLYSLIIPAIIVMAPVSAGLLLPLFIGLFIVGYLKRDRFLYGAYMVVIFFTTLCLVVMLSLNLLTSGMAEATPLPLFFKYSIKDLLDKWVGSEYINLFIENHKLCSHGIGEFIYDFKHRLLMRISLYTLDDTMLPLPVYIVVFVISVLTLRVSFQKFAVMLPLLVLLLFLFAFSSIMQQNSIDRFFSTIIVFIKTFLYIIILANFCELLTVVGSKRTGVLVVSITCVFFILLNNPAFKDKDISGNFERVTYGTGKSLNVIDMSKFLIGDFSYADLYEKRWMTIMMGKKIKDLLGDGSRVGVLNFVSGLPVIPGGHFIFCRSCDIFAKADFHALHFGSVSSALHALQRNNIQYILVDYTNRWGPLFPIAFSKLFEPDNVREYFRLVGMGDGFLLLTLLDKGRPLGDDILGVYRAIWEHSRRTCYGKAYDALLEKVKREGGLEGSISKSP